MIEGKVDIFVVTDTKLDSNFPTSQFYINSFTKNMTDLIEIEMQEGFLFIFSIIY